MDGRDGRDGRGPCPPPAPGLSSHRVRPPRINHHASAPRPRHPSCTAERSSSATLLPNASPHRPLRGPVPLRAREAATVASASASANFALRLSWAGWKLFLRRSGWCPRGHCDDRWPPRPCPHSPAARRHACCSRRSPAAPRLSCSRPRLTRAGCARSTPRTRRQRRAARATPPPGQSPGWWPPGALGWRCLPPARPPQGRRRRRHPSASPRCAPASASRGIFGRRRPATQSRR